MGIGNVGPLLAVHNTNLRSIALGRRADWDDPEWRMLDMGGYGSGARWHLNIAIRDNNLELAAWCLAHGASANAAPPKAKALPHRSLYEEAVARGETEIAALLERHGARTSSAVLDDRTAFIAACLHRTKRRRAGISPHIPST